MCFLQIVLKCSRYLSTSSFGIISHLVESLTIIVVLQLTERLHCLVEIIVYDSKAITVVLERFPSWKSQILRIVNQYQTTLQHIGSTHRSKAVEIETYYKHCVVGQ